MFGGKWIEHANEKLMRRIRIENLDNKTKILIQTELKDLYSLAEKIDKGDLKYECLSRS